MGTLLDRETQIQTRLDEPGYSNYVRLGGKVGVSGGYGTHRNLALDDGLYDQSDEGFKPIVDDGGLLVVIGDSLQIPKYRTSSCSIRDNRDFDEVRRQTAQEVANIKRMNVEFVKRDGSIEIVFPQ